MDSTSYNDKIQMPKAKSNPNVKGAKSASTYDLAERTACFGEACVTFAKQLPGTEVARPLRLQFVRAATSIGANYMEADAAESKKDFRHKIGLCKKEAKETGYWLRMIATAVPESADKARGLWKESHELLLIFSAINRKN